MAYYSAYQSQEILTHAKTQMNLKDLMLSEKDRDCMISLL